MTSYQIRHVEGSKCAVRCVQVDKHGRGWLKEAELYRLCTFVVPDISPGQLRYVEVMLDHDGDGKVSFTDLQHLATISKRTGLAFTVKAQLDATDVLKKAAVFMYDKRLTIREFFARFDDHHMLKLSKKMIATIVRVVMKSASQAEAAKLVKEFVKVFDMDTDGFISYGEFCRAMAEGEPNQPNLEADWGAIDIRTDFDNQGGSLTSNTLRRLKGEHSVLRKVRLHFAYQLSLG
jgi:Ca2+-binding EF-hand superfamily protein